MAAPSVQGLTRLKPRSPQSHIPAGGSGRSAFRGPSCRTEVPASAPASCPPPGAPVCHDSLSLPYPPEGTELPRDPDGKGPAQQPGKTLLGPLHSAADPFPAPAEKHSDHSQEPPLADAMNRVPAWNLEKHGVSHTCPTPPAATSAAPAAPSACLPADRTRGICTSGDESLT